MKFVSKTCPLCGSQKASVAYQFEHFSILTCKKCGLQRRNLKLDQKERQKLYSKHYFVTEQKEYFAPCLKDLQKEDNRIKDFSSRLAQLDNLLTAKTKKLLDIGCATGTFIKLAQEKNWQVQGIDISKFAIDLAKKEGLKAQVFSLENFPIPHNKFNAITAWEVVPNFENPNLGFQKIAAMLKPNGVVAIQLTVVDSLLFFLSDLLYRLSFGQLKFFIANGYPINHTCHFSRKTLKKFLAKYNLKIIKATNVEFDFRYSKMPKVILPVLQLIGFLAKKINRTTQYRVFAKLK